MDTAQPTPLNTPVTIPVNGVSFRQDIVRSLTEEDRVVLRRERDNEFDANAIAIYTLDGDHVGFVPRKIAERFAADPTERWGGVVREVLRGETWGLRVAMTHTNIPDFPVKPRTVSYAPTTPVADAPTEAVAGEVPVYAKSGRFLGTTADPDGDGKVVVVTSDSGDVRRYPTAVVTVAS